MKLLYWAEALLLRAIVAVLRALGPVRASNLGGSVARTLGPLLPVSRVADINLRLAFPDFDATTRARIIRGVWENLGRTIAEWPHLGRLTQTMHGPGWELVGSEILTEIAQHGGGPAIFFSAHIGNWEMLPRIAAAHGVMLSSAYRPPDNPAMEQLVKELRRAATGAALPMFPKGAQGARAAMAHLMQGGCIGMLVDQKMNDGIAVDFFGRPAMTAPALAALALRFRCPVIPGHVERIGPARFRAVCEKPLPLPDSGDRATDIAALMRAVNACLERWVRERPDSWLWLHRRWGKELYVRARNEPFGYGSAGRPADSKPR